MSETTTAAQSSRIYYFDYLKLFVIVLVIALHALLPHVSGFEWYVNDPQTSGLFSLASLFIDVFIMPTMFFVAGYFTYSSLQKRGAKRFLYNKFKRIGLPFLIGMVGFVPIISYTERAADGAVDVGFVTYWMNSYFTAGMHTAHYWFLGLLFVFFLSFAVVYVLYGDRIDRMATRPNGPLANANPVVSIAAFLGLGIGLFFLASLFSADGRWVYVFGVFNLQPTRATGYVLYFYLGILVYLNDVTIPQRVLDKLWLVTSGTVLLASLYLAYRAPLYTAIADSVPLKFGNATLHVVLCFAVFVTLVLTFKKYLHQSSTALNRLARTSYSIYFFHLVIVVVLQYYLLSVSVSPLAKFAIVFSVGFVASYLLSELYLYSLDGLRNLVRNGSIPRVSRQQNEFE